jgi:predicted nucleotidyltransferase
MSGNFVQRGDVAVFSKHVRAQAAVSCGADLVIELPLPVALSSAEGFALGGVRLLDALGVVTHLSFGSEAGEADCLREAADCLVGNEAPALIRQELKSGKSYAAARYIAARRLLGPAADVLKSPNNILGVAYLQALCAASSPMLPVTIPRRGAAHDSDGPESASHLRQLLRDGLEPWRLMPEPAAVIYREEIARGRGPVFIDALDTAVLSRLRMLPNDAWRSLPDASEGLEDRLMRFARTQPTLGKVLASAKTKRYALSRLRRMALTAALGIEAGTRAGRRRISACWRRARWGGCCCGRSRRRLTCRSLRSPRPSRRSMRARRPCSSLRPPRPTYMRWPIRTRRTEWADRSGRRVPPRCNRQTARRKDDGRD